jgi:hypothetical protein
MHPLNPQSQGRPSSRKPLFINCGPALPIPREMVRSGKHDRTWGDRTNSRQFPTLPLSISHSCRCYEADTEQYTDLTCKCINWLDLMTHTRWCSHMGAIYQSWAVLLRSLADLVGRRAITIRCSQHKTRRHRTRAI